MAELLSPVKEEPRRECVKHGHEMDDDRDETQSAEHYEKGWFATGMSVIWWGTSPVRYTVDKVANIYAPTGKFLLGAADAVTEAIQSNFPYMTDEESEKTMAQLRDMVYRSARHNMRSAIRTKPGRTLLLGLDKVITVSESVLDTIEGNKREDKNEDQKKQSMSFSKQMDDVMKRFNVKKPDEFSKHTDVDKYEEAKITDVTAKFEEMSRGDDYDDVDEESRKREDATKRDDVKKRETARKSDEPGPAKDRNEQEYERWVALKRRYQSDKVEEKKKSEKKIGLIRRLLAMPLRLWISGLKYVRRFLYRTGRLRRCKTTTRTPAKEIARRPKVSPKKRQPAMTSFSSMVKQVLSPIASKQQTVTADQLKDVKTIDLGVPAKRKHYHVAPYSCGDDSDSDTGRIIDDYFMLHDYDSSQDSDYVWYTSDDLPTSDSEEFRTDTEDEDLTQEAGDLANDALEDMKMTKGEKRRSLKKTSKPSGKPESETGDPAHYTSYTGDPAKSMGYSTDPAKSMGYSTDPAKAMGYSTDPAKAMGYSNDPAKSMGYSTDSTKSMDFSTDPMKSMGFADSENSNATGDDVTKTEPQKSPARPETSLNPIDPISPKSTDKAASDGKGKQKSKKSKSPQTDKKDSVESFLPGF